MAVITAHHAGMADHIAVGVVAAQEVKLLEAICLTMQSVISLVSWRGACSKE